MFKKLILMSLGGLVLSGAAVAGQWSLADDFSVTNNRNGQWAYGTSNTLGRFTLARKSGPLGRYTFDPGGASAWQGSAGTGPEYYPLIAKFFGQPGTTVTMLDELNGGNANIKLRAGGVLMHPGPNGEFAVVRWRSKASTTYHVSAVFHSCDAVQGATTDVHVLKSGTPLFNGNIAGTASTSAWMSGNAGIYVAQGEHLDFAVGTGSNNDYSYDSTCVDVTIRTLDVRGSGEPVRISND